MRRIHTVAARGPRPVLALVTVLALACGLTVALSAPSLASVAQAPLADCSTPVRTPVPDGSPIVVSLPPAAPFTVGRIPSSAWRHPWVSDLPWRLAFEGFTYLPGLAARAYVDMQAASLSTMVAQVAAFHVQDPDPGSVAYGWDEGTAQRRLETEICLYSLTHDARLVPGMRADARVQLGPRYYGPPYRMVHNHGLMANLRLVRAGELLGYSTWTSTGLSRMRYEAPLAFSRLGTSWEQASSYQKFNVALWTKAAGVLAAKPAYATTASVIRAVTAKGNQVLRWLTEPDGALVQIGDSAREAGLRSSGTARVFRDDQAGYVVGRWSWSSATTSYYTLRYGPRRRAHGQLDRGSLTWTTAGVRVLVGPGVFGYGSSRYAIWQATPVAHNVAVPVTGAYRDTGTATVASEVVQAPAHAWLMKDTLYPSPHSRGVNVNGTTRTLRVVDGYGGVAFRQTWHLDPAWQLVSAPLNGQRLVFRHPSGRRLTVTTTGRLSGVRRGATSPVMGWGFPSLGTRVPAYQITLRSVLPTVTTRFVVT